jgi:hypothetical protein
MRLMHRLSAIAVAAALPILISTQPAAVITPGRVLLVKKTSPDFDSFTNAPNGVVQQWMRNNFWRMLVYSPSFDKKTSWYQAGWIYLDSYAIYRNPSNGESLAGLHPDWVLRDDRNSTLYIPWGCDPASHTCPQYAADFSNPDFRQWWVDKAKSSLGRGKYKGLWIDDVNFDARISDGDGTPASPIDSRTGQPMTIDDWRRYFAEFLEKVRADLPDIEIVTNSIWFAGGSARDENIYVQRQIAASDLITVEHGVNDSGLTGGDGIWSLNALLAYIDRVNSAGKGVILGGLGGDDPNDPVPVEYTVACYFLISNGANAVGDFGMVVTPEKWFPVLDVNLGTPLGPRFAWSGLLRRDFTGGMVLVNPPKGPTVTVAVPGSYRNISGQPVDTITLGPARGLILIAAPPQ